MSPPDDYDAFRVYLERTVGIRLGDGKQYLVQSRLAPLYSELKIAGLGELVRRLEANPSAALRTRVLDAMTTQETSWFRDPQTFAALTEQILPGFAQAGRRQCRIWSAACATGQEPYSLAILLREFATGRPGVFPDGMRITATDVSSAAMGRAVAGRFDAHELNRGLSPERRRHHFAAAEYDQAEALAGIRSLVQFRPFNLLDSYTSLGRFDVIFIRNVLIYMPAERKRDILERMAQVLAPDGWLFLGAAESLTGVTDAYRMTRVGDALGWRPCTLAGGQARCA